MDIPTKRNVSLQFRRFSLCLTSWKKNLNWIRLQRISWSLCPMNRYKFYSCSTLWNWLCASTNQHARILTSFICILNIFSTFSPQTLVHWQISEMLDVRRLNANKRAIWRHSSIFVSLIFHLTLIFWSED